MPRITPIDPHHAGLKARLVLRFGPMMMKRMAGTAPANGLEPVAVYAHAPRLLSGILKFEQASAKLHRLDPRLNHLAQLKTATLVGCEYCIDLGSQIARHSGMSDEELLALPRYRESPLFSELDKLVLDYAVAMTRTPAEVSDELFARLHEHLDTERLLELTHAIALEGYRSRMNWALGIGSAGFSQGMVCAVPERPAAVNGHGASPLAHTP
jgi:AhpD family alkylhydroperoxidase